MNLTYGILYNPENAVNNNINYICSDNKIHIRFRDYTKEQVITGFEQKLAYLMTYLANYSEFKNMLERYTPDELTKCMLQSSDVKNIFEAIRYAKQINFKGFKLYQNYKKTATSLPFGDVDSNAFPIRKDTYEIIKLGSLEYFLKKLKIGLIDYLFNDGYSVIIYRKSTKDVNKKFINKENKKSNFELDSDYVPLW